MYKEKKKAEFQTEVDKSTIIERDLNISHLFIIDQEDENWYWKTVKT